MNQRALGALISYASIFINMAIAIFFTPLLVSSLGQSEFGLFNIVGSFAAYLVILDMGMNDSVVRYLLRLKSNASAEMNFMANTFLFYLGVSFIAAILGFWLYNSIDVFFELTLNHKEIESLKLMTLIILINAIVTILFNPVTSFLIAKQRFVFIYSSAIFLRILTTIFLIAFLLNGYKAVTVVLITALLNSFLLILKLIYALNLGLKVKLTRFNLTIIKKLLRYSAPIFVVVIVELIYWKLDNIILAKMIGAKAVAVFAIGMMFHKYFMSFSTAISKVMMPKIINQLDSGATPIEMEKTLTMISRSQGFVIMLILTGVVIFGKSFLLLWLGPKYTDAYWIMVFTLVPYSLELMGNVRNIFLQVNHLYWYRAAIVFTVAIFNIFTTIFAIKKFGMIGASISTGIAVLIGYFSVNFIVWKKLKINVFRYMQNLFSGLVPTLIVCALLGFAINKLGVSSWVDFFAQILIYSIIYFILIFYLGMNKDEKSYFKNTLKNKTFVN